MALAILRRNRVLCSRSAAAAQRGFTLIEIMVVVVIIGLLAAIVVPNMMGYTETAAVSRAKQDIRAIETALNLYRLDNYRYPTTDEGLEMLVAGGNTEGGRQYLRRLPVDPWNNPYQYVQPGRRGEFDLYSLGANGQEGGEGIDAEIGNWDLD